MCGIAGFCGMPDDAKHQIKLMTNAMISRGPDAGEFWEEEDGSVVFGHRRLSIIDLTETGRQPMISHSKRLVMTLNGEIYNYTEIKKELQKQRPSIVFRGTSDTEVLLEAIEEWGVRGALEKCNGMFAFAVYDRREKRLFLARDRAGEKPLYYGFVNGNFVFASDLKCIETVRGFQKNINRDVLSHYLMHGVIPAPFSVYEGIYKLMPGRILQSEFPFSGYKEEIYWSMTECVKNGQRNPFEGTEDEAAQELERLLVKSVRGQMMSDVPIGCFLSAGIDSATVTAVMQRLSGKAVKTFTIGFKDKENDEALAAAKIAEYLGTDHSELFVDEKQVKNIIPLLPEIYSEPFADSSQIPTYLVSKLAKGKVTVALSGDAGDELFCGYTAYPSVEESWRKLAKIPRMIRRTGGRAIHFFNGFGNIPTQIHGKMLLSESPSDLRRNSLNGGYLVDQLLSEKKTGLKNMVSIPDMELKQNLMLEDFLDYLPNDILVKVDRAAMAVSLETRAPFLDKHIIEFAWRLPVSFHYRNGVGKRILRNVLYKYVPENLMDRPKTGFSIPLEKWLREEPLKSWAQELLHIEAIRKHGLFDAGCVAKMWDEYTRKGIWRDQIWYLLVFQQWYCQI